MRDVLVARIDELPASLLFDNFALLQRMRKWKRADHTRVLRGVDRVLTSPAAATSRWEALRHPSRRVRRAAVELSFRCDPQVVPDLIDYVLDSRDRSLRKAAVRLLNRLPDDEVEPTAARFLFDTDGDIRAWAQRRALRREELADCYRRELTAGTRLRAAL